MNNNDRELTLADVVNTPDEPGWLNGTVSAHVLKVETIAKKAGGQFWKATLGPALGDFTGGVTLSLFQPPKFQQGDQIRLGGGGLKKTSYMGKPQINLGKSSTVEVLLGGGVQRVQQAMHETKAQSENNGLISGQAVGCALNNAWETARHCYGEALIRELDKPLFWQWLHAVSSDHIRISQMLEKGTLADPVKVRQGRPIPSSQPPQRSHDPERELDEGVPF